MMRDSQDKDQQKQTARKSGATRSPRTKAQDPQKRPDIKAQNQPTPPEESTSMPTGRVLTQEEFGSRISRKAFELYEKRRALTEVDDWVEAERLVKLELLNEQDKVGSV